MKLQSITNLCGLKNNSGTWHLLYYIPIGWVDPATWDYPTGARVDRKVTAEVLKVGESWLTMPAIIKTKSIAASTSKSMQGVSVGISIPGMIPFWNENINEQLARMQHERFVIKVKFADGEYMIGSPDHPMEFSYKLSSAPNQSGTKGVNFEFVGAAMTFARIMAIEPI